MRSVARIEEFFHVRYCFAFILYLPINLSPLFRLTGCFFSLFSIFGSLLELVITVEKVYCLKYSICYFAIIADRIDCCACF